jgi:hypothetical protein
MKLNYIAPLLAAGAAAVAIAAAPIAAAAPTTGQSCSPSGTGTICQSPGNAQINDAPPPVQYYPYGGEAFLLWITQRWRIHRCLGPLVEGVLHRRYHARRGVAEDRVSGRRGGGDVQAVEDEVRSLGEQQRILAAERFAPGAIPDHRRFTPCGVAIPHSS